MTLNEWSLSRLIATIGAVAAAALFVPIGFYLAHSVSSSADHALAEYGTSMARTLGGQIVPSLLTQDRLSLLDMLASAKASNDGVCYLAVEDARGQVVADTFPEGCPTGLTALWARERGRSVRYRSEKGRMMDLAAPIMDGQLGHIHVGMSRIGAVRATRRVIGVMGGSLLGALAVVFLGAQVVAAQASRPLEQLEAEIARFPEKADPEAVRNIAGTREVGVLANGFAQMAQRTESLVREQEATQEQMVRTERLAALGELAAGLAHEVRNPLDGMQECLRYLETDPDKSERATKYYPLLTEGLARIGRVMREALTFASSGRKPSTEPCRTADVVKSLSLLVEKQLEGRNVKLTWQHPGGCACLCDMQGLSQAVLNLVLNAAESAEGSAQPEVRIEASCDDRWVHIIVEDSGAGVPRELRQKVFEPFFTTKPMAVGTGLGLSVSRELIRASGGTLELSREPGSLAGARFTIRLPRISERQDGQV